MANAFQDALMTQRSQKQSPGLSINWGPWGEVGMAAQLDKTLEHYNLRKILPEQGLEALETLMSLNSYSEVAVIDCKSSMQTPLPISEFAFSVWNISAEGSAVTELAYFQDQPSQKNILQFITQCISEILGSRSLKSYEEDQSFHDIGIDSLMSLQLRDKLSKALKLRLSATLIYKFPTIGSLVNFLFEEFKLRTSDAKNCIVDPSPSETISTLEEVALELEKELNSLREGVSNYDEAL